MKYCLYLTAIVALAFHGIPARAQQDANPVDVSTVLKDLSNIKKVQEDGSKATKLKLAQQFLTTAGDTGAAVNYYKEAIRATKFEGISRESTQFQQWEKDEAEHLKSKAFRDALSYHLTYLSLTLRRSAGLEVRDLLPDLINYTQQVMTEEDQGGGPAQQSGGMTGRQSRRPPSAQSLIAPPSAPPSLDAELMKPDLTSSIFVVWMQIEKYVSDADDWELSPGNVNGIYDQTILPEYRRTRDPRLLQYWDTRIQREADLAAKSGRNFDVDKFNQTTLPQLRWKRTQELIALGLKNRAINDMVALIKTYPTHPDVPSWIQTVQQMLRPPAGQPVTGSPAGQPRG